MPGNNEDYLDGLLDSITKAKSNARSSERRERSGREERIARRSRIRPEDDFMEANGLYDTSYRRRDRRSRRGRKSAIDDDFFDGLAGDFSDDDDDFIRAFERELAESGNDDVFDIRDINKDDDFFSHDEDKPAASAKGASAKDSVLDDIANIVSEAKAKIEEGNSELLDSINEQMNGPAPESFTAGMPGGAPTDAPSSAAAEDILSPEYAEDELDLSDTLALGTDAKEVDLMDESGDDVDLMDMLSADGDEGLVDIGELLSSDESGEELSETREAFEAGAKSAESGGGGAEADGGDSEEEKKPGLLARIISIFKKKGTDDDESAIGIVDPTLEQLAAESEELAGEYDEDEDDDGESPEEKKARKKKEKEEEKAKKKKEKEEAKKAKDAAKKEAAEKKAAAKAAKAAAKAAKPKKKKKKGPPEPKIPILAILPFLLLSVSIVAGTNIIMKVMSYEPVVNEALESYEKQDYIDAYAALAGLTLNPEDQVLRDSAKTMAFLQTKYREYQVCMDIGKYQMALDSLVNGVYFYTDNADMAKSLDIVDVYNEYGNTLERALAEDFNLTPEDATDIWKSLTRKDYTTKIQRAVRAAGLEDEY